jgi:tetratricopeptide (TPR) repeat protein
VDAPRADVTVPRAASLIGRCLRMGSGWLENRGRAWFHSRYLPALAAIEGAQPIPDRTLLAGAYCLVGDVHFYHCAHRAALRAYLRALEHDPHMCAAMCDAGDVYYLLGDSANAEGYYLMCLAEDPGHTYALDALSQLKFKGPRGRRDRAASRLLLRRANEALAVGEARRVLAMLDPRRHRSTEARKLRASAYGALGEMDSHLREWAAIARQRGEFEITFSDIFFMPEAAWHTTAFWSVLLRCAERVSSSCLTPMGLVDGLPDPTRSRARSKASRRRRTRRFRIVMKYHIWRVNADVQQLRSLQRQFPSWAGLAQLIAFRDRHGRMPKELTPEQKGFTYPLRPRSGQLGGQFQVYSSPINSS